MIIPKIVEPFGEMIKNHKSCQHAFLKNQLFILNNFNNMKMYDFTSNQWNTLVTFKESKIPEQLCFGNSLFTQNDFLYVQLAKHSNQIQINCKIQYQ